MVRTNPLKFVGRALVIGILVLPFGLVLLLMPWTLGLATLIIVKMLLPSILGGFFMFAFSDYLWLKFYLAEIQQTTSTGEGIIIANGEECAIEFTTEKKMKHVHNSGDKLKA